MTEGRHDGRLIVLTGGSSGIGQAIALRLVSEGARIAIADVGDVAETVELAGPHGDSITGLRCDISDSEQVQGFADQVRTDLGNPDVLVHCAAMQFIKPFAELTIDEWRATQRVNLDGGFLLAQQFLPAMIEAQWGRIIMIASSSYFSPPAMMTHYIASKGALLGMVRGLATEVGPHGITVNAVAPGLTRTRNAIESVPQEHFDFVLSRQQLKRSGKPEDQAGAVSFLASEDAGFMTGQTLLVDGGEGHV
jgi:NAD(P)-dependent dehydrogenase (short-subunit alcohol dehydrogenase family)